MSSHTTRIGVVFGASQRLRGACAVLAHLARRQQPVAVYCPHEERLAELDHLLWEYDSNAFVPHVEADDPWHAHTPVTLHRQLPVAGSALVLNLDDAPLDPALGYAWILEVVGAAPDDRARGRDHWRHYQAAACQLQAYDLNRNQLP